MFTGIIEKIAQVVSIKPQDSGIRITLNTGWQDIISGESICVNGACLTALSDAEQAEFDISPETLDKTCFSMLQTGDWVNLERSMPVNGRFSGHYVTGHVDTRAKLIHRKQVGDYHALTFSQFEDSKAIRYLLGKGSITINGVSLTINQVRNSEIDVMIIPHTLAQTNLSEISIGDLVNIEFDYLARLIAHQVRLIQQEVEDI